MRTYTLALLGLLSGVLANGLPGALRAQELGVRSGEHGEFTRLVLPLLQGVEWSLNHEDGDYTLSYAQQDVTFDTSRVFDLIPRTRLSDLTAQGPALTLDLACACRADAFEFRSTNLVIDIREGTPDEATASEPENPADTQDTAKVTPPPPPPILPISGGLAGLSEPENSTPVMSLPSVIAPAGAFDIDSQERIKTTGREIAEGIARAANQGLLNPTSDLPDLNAISERTSAPPEPLVLPDYTLPDQLAVRAETSIERAVDQMQIGVSEADRFSGCRPGYEFDVASWGDERAFAIQMGETWGAATSALDGDEKEAMRTLARRYIYFGFGAEALQIMSQTEDESAEAVSLRGIAALLDDPKNLTHKSPFADQARCESPAALWGVLANINIETPDKVAKSAILRAFQSLPLHLRAHLGPTLSDRFLKAGDTNTADALARFLSRAVHDDSPSMLLNRAHLAVANGKYDQASALLSELIKSSDPASLQGSVELVDLHLEQGWRIPEDITSLIGARAFEFRYDEMGPELAAAHVLALAMSQEFDRAMEELRAGVEIGALPASLAKKITVLVTKQASDVTFLRFTMNPEYQALSTPDLAQEARLLSLGFAEEVLRRLGRAQPTAEVMHLQAEAHLALGEGLAAMAALGDLEDPVAATLRSDAMELINGDTQPAPTPDPWRSGNWEEVLRTEDDSLVRAAEWMTESLPSGAPVVRAQSELVAVSQTALEQSAAERAELDQLLARFPKADIGAETTTSPDS